MKYLLLALLACVAQTASAHQPVFVSPQNADDRTEIIEPTISRAFYGTLLGFPHTYQIHVTEPTQLYVQILEPNLASAEENHRVAIIRQRDDGRGYELVTMLDPTSVDWEISYEPFGGDSYRHGPEYEAEISPGVYLIEVSTVRNQGKYTLVVGRTEDFSGVGLFGLLKGIYHVKIFFEKPAVAVLQSPFYYVPVGVFVIISLSIYWYRRRRL